MRNLLSLMIVLLLVLANSCNPKQEGVTSHVYSKGELTALIAHEEVFVTTIKQYSRVRDSISIAFNGLTQVEFSMLKESILGKGNTQEAIKIGSKVGIQTILANYKSVSEEVAKKLLAKYKSSFDALEPNEVSSVFVGAYKNVSTPNLRMQGGMESKDVCDDCVANLGTFGAWQLTYAVLCIRGYSGFCSDTAINVGIFVDGVCYYCCQPGIHCR